ncbi:MAG TPA: EI24 domain-containing protein [Myxococcales bacterium]|nr:EI24 domain-containing protein [Myxococcales bacterium]
MDQASPIPAIPPRGGPLDFARGLRLPFSAFRLIFRSPRLFGLSLLASAVTLAGLVGSVVAWWRFTGPLLETVIQEPEPGLTRWLWKVLWGLLFLLLTAITMNTVPVLLLAPLQDPLSEATEELCGDRQSRPFSVGRMLAESATSIGHTLARIAILLAGHAALFVLHFVPVVGSLAWTVLGPAWTMTWLATEYLDAPMARHLYHFRQVRSVVFRRLGLSLGFGAAVYVLLWVPLLNLFFIPVAVISGTLLFRALRQSGDLPAPAPR